MSEIEFKDLSLSIGAANLLKGVNLTIGAKEFVALVGPNGAGKTSLLQCAFGLQTPSSGGVTVNGTSAAELTPLERAHAISYLPQSSPLAWPIVVRDVVALGRFAYGASLSTLKGDDQAAVERAIVECELTGLTTRNSDTLSGGELARVHFARALAANSSLLLADEPTAGLDPYHQFKILELIKRFVDNGGGALVVLHDISLAARFANRIIWMKDGEIVGDGSPRDTLTEQRLREIYDINAAVRYEHGEPVVIMQNAVSNEQHNQNGGDA